MRQECAAGRLLVALEKDDPFWNQPCPNEGTDLLVIGDDSPGRPSVSMYICRKHIVQIPNARLAQ